MLFTREHMRVDELGPLPPLQPAAAFNSAERDIADALWLGVDPRDVDTYRDYFRGEHRPTTERDA